MTFKIYPDSWAHLCIDKAGEKYRPSNGIEGEMFISTWCYKCRRDRVQNGEIDLQNAVAEDMCEILNDSHMFDTNEDEYPAELQYGKDGQPCCTGFDPIDGVVSRCPNTMELF